MAKLKQVEPEVPKPPTREERIQEIAKWPRLRDAYGNWEMECNWEQRRRIAIEKVQHEEVLERAAAVNRAYLRSVGQ